MLSYKYCGLYGGFETFYRFVSVAKITIFGYTLAFSSKKNKDPSC